MNSESSAFHTAIFDALCACLDQFWEAMGEVPLEGKDFLRLLELLLRNRDMGAIPAALDCVSLGSPGRLRGRKPRKRWRSPHGCSGNPSTAWKCGFPTRHAFRESPLPLSRRR